MGGAITPDIAMRETPIRYRRKIPAVVSELTLQFHPSGYAIANHAIAATDTTIPAYTRYFAVSR